MKIEEFLKIFSLDEMHKNNKGKLPFLLRFQNSTLTNKTHIVFYFENDNISLSITMPDLKNIFLNFNIEENNDIVFTKSQNFKNEIFSHLTFEKNLKIDLEFLSGIIYKILIPQYCLKYSFENIECD